MPTINLLEKYHPRLLNALNYESNLPGKTTKEYKIDGAHGIYLTELDSVALTNYNMAATANRYGTPTEIGDKQQLIEWDYDVGYPITVDKANYRDGGFMKTAEAVIKNQNEIVVAPFIEQNFYQKLCYGAGKVITGNAPSSADIMSRLTSIEAAMRNARIPKNDRFVAIGTTVFQLIRHALTNCDGITDKMLLKGLVGRIGSLNVLETADDDLPTDVWMISWWKRSALLAFDIKDANVHTNPPGISGLLVEYRVRGVADVVGKYAGGVVVDCKSTAKQAAPSISNAGAITVGSSSDYTKYTVDGTDPRYSKTAVKITSGTTPSHTAGDTIKAVSYKAGLCVSDVATKVTTS